MDDRAGCTKYCCTHALMDIPPKPFGVAWIDYAPHMTGDQSTRLTGKWERIYSRNTGQPQRRWLNGWPADLGESVRLERETREREQAERERAA